MLAAHTGNAGEVSEGNPLIDMLDMSFEGAGENAAFFGGVPKAEEVERGADAVGVEPFEIGAAESGELIDRPVSRRNAVAWRMHGIGSWSGGSRHNALFAMGSNSKLYLPT